MDIFGELVPIHADSIYTEPAQSKIFPLENFASANLSGG